MTTRRSLLLIPLMGIARAEPNPQRVCRVSAWVDGLENHGTELAWRAAVQGREAKVVRVRSPQDPLVLLLVTDLTGDLTLVDPAREATAQAIQTLPENAWVALLRSQDGLQAIVDPTPDRNAVITALRGLQIAGRAGLLETVEAAAALASRILRRSPLRLATLYLTDSDIANYREDFTNPVINYSDTRDLSRRFPEALVREKTAKLAATMAAAEAPIFIVHLAFLRDRLNEAYQTGLQRIAEASGGAALFCRSVAEISSAVASAFQRAVSHWAIDVALPDNTPKQYNVTLTAGEYSVRQRTVFALAKK